MRYVAIRSEGNLIPYDLLDKIAVEDTPGQKPADFGLPKGRRLVEEISRVWADAQNLWSNFKRRRQSLTDSSSAASVRDPYGTSITRTWIMSLFSDPEMLGFDLKLLSNAVVVNNVNFPVSHRNGESEDAIPVHIEGCKIDLDRRLNTKLRTSPQAMLQDFLNNSEHVLWGVLTNGLTVRLLRDSSRTSRPTYLEFDLESIFEGNRFNEFALFYRLLHRSRFPQPGKEPADCLLEKYYQDSIEQGLRIRDKLRDGVEDALRTLGTAFLQHPANYALREKYSSGRLTPEKYHRQLLLLVYRLLFLMVAEERKLIVAQGESAERHQKIYDECYSITRLRDRAARIVEQSPFGDLWEGLKQTFSLFEYGADRNALGVPPLNGDLFDERRAIPDLAGTELYNHELLLALRRLSLFKTGNTYQRVNYSALDVEELGSVYESLLDFKPVIAQGEKGFTFDLRVGMERKSTGSYYTRPELVHELIESALVPVMEDRLAEAEKAATGQDLLGERKAKERAILSMSVCDPACGSGHFLLAAARRLGKELARARTGEDEPRPEEFHLAVRDVISHCVYGVDLNPLAVDLCKLALWLEGHWIGKPLSFLDHRIRCGNSLVGILDPEVMAEGIPDEAFTAVVGDDKKIAAAFRKQNKQERVSRQRGFDFDTDDHSAEYAKARRQLEAVVEDSPAEVRRKAELYSSWRAGMQHAHDEAVADLWTAQFFNPLNEVGLNDVCPTGDFLAVALDKEKRPRQVAAAKALAERIRFFHWPLEFPEVFERGGFDVVLGNPPWEILQPEEVAFFQAHGFSEIARLPGSRRKQAIAQLWESNPAVIEHWHAYEYDIYKQNSFLKNSGRFRLTAVGKINTDSLFCELAFALLNGRCGIVIPSGIATDDSTHLFFSKLNQQGAIVSLFDFENRLRLFPDVAPVQKFCLLTISKQQQQESRFAFFLTEPNQMFDQRRVFSLRSKEFELLNPNTLTCPTFRTVADAEITKQLYRHAPVLILGSHGNPWSIRLRQGLFNMTSDSGLFSVERAKDSLPLYEGKFFQQFDHRHGSYEGIPEQDRFGVRAGTTTPTVGQKINPEYSIEPRYWVRRSDVSERLPKGYTRQWFLAFRLIVRSSCDHHVSVWSILPVVGVGHSAAVAFISDHSIIPKSPCLLANLNSLVFDYILRQKMGGANFVFSILEQAAVLPPEMYKPDDVSFLTERVLRLVYTSDDLAPFANDIGYVGSPFQFDVDQRTELRAELDAYVAHLYGLTREALRYILDPADVMGGDYPTETFRVLQDQELEQYGEYRTRRLVLEAFDKLAEGDRFRGEMATRKSVFDIPARKSLVAVQ